MQKITKTEKQYEKLRKELETIIEAARAKLEKASRETSVETHWEVGKCLSSSIGEPETESAGKIIQRLADDLGLHNTVLYRSLKFFRAYADGLPSSSEFKALPWSSHAELLKITDEEERGFYISRAAEDEWSVKKLRDAISADEYRGGKKKKKRALEKTVLERPVPGLYTYEAELERIVDGDTIIVRIDLGFDVLKRERIRLKGVDAAEIDTDEGKKAEKFVRNKLKGIEKVILRTHWHDMYGRYVADVLYDPGGLSKDDVLLKGSFLNQELLDNGMAQPA